MQKELKSRQICLFFIAFIPIYKFFMMPSVTASFANEDMWLCSLVFVLFDGLTIFSLISVCKSAKKDFFSLLSDCFGRVVKNVVLALYFAYFILKAIIPLNEQKDYVELTLYTLMPTMLYFLPFFIFAFYICTKKLRVLGRAGDILWIFTLIGTLILFALSITNADFTAILPIGARGIKSVLSGAYRIPTWFGDGAYFMFFVGEFLYRKKDGIKIMASYLLGGIIVIIFMIIFYTVFTSIAFRQRFALTEISKYSTVINNIGRFDYIGIFMLLLSNMFSLSVPLFFACRILNHMFSFKKAWISPAIVIGIESLIMILFYQYLYSIENFIMNYLSVFLIIMGNLFPMIFALVYNLKQRKENAYAN